MFEAKAYRTRVLEEPRVLSRVPSDEMTQLSVIVTGIWKEYRGRLCQDSPQNFVGTLQVARHKNALARIYAKQGKKVPDIIQNPYQLIEGPIALNVYDGINQIYVDISSVVAPEFRKNVLVKKAVGRKAGIILSGPLSGLILSIKGYFEDESIYCVNRVWNEYLFEPLGSYGSWWLRRNPDGVNFIGGSELEPANERCQEYLDEKFKELIVDYPIVSQAFFKLLSDLKIDHDEAEFHMSRELTKDDASDII